MKHVTRIGPAWLRCPLLLVAWPVSFLHGLWMAPQGRMGDYCRLSVQSFGPAWRGEFVPK